MVDLESIHLTRDERIALCALKARKQIDRSVGFRLSLLSLAYCTKPSAGEPFAISADGERWLELDRTKRRDVRWSRGLSIAAIVISLAALILEIQSRGWFSVFIP